MIVVGFFWGEDRGQKEDFVLFFLKFLTTSRVEQELLAIDELSRSVG